MAVVSAELVKIRSLPSMVATLGLTAALTIGLGLVAGLSVRAAIDQGGSRVSPDFTPAAAGFHAVLYGQLGLIVFGVLVFTQEYTSGMIRISLLAVPGRAMFHVGKLAALTGTTLAVAVPMCTAAFVATQVGLGRHGISPLARGVPAALAGSVLYLVLVCLFAAGIAGIVRNAVAALSILIPLFFVAPVLLNAIAAVRDLAHWLPGSVGIQMMGVSSLSGNELGPAAGAVALLAWALAAVGGAHLLLRRHDA